MQAQLYSQSGEPIGVVEINEYIFGIEPNVAVMHQAMVRQQANKRLGTHNTRGRGELSGSTRKLYRQKGTGRARQGSVRASHRRGGGVAHGPHPRSYEKKMPRKMRRLAVRSALSAKYAAEQIRFIESLEMDVPRTRDMLAFLDNQALSGKTLIVLNEKDEIVTLSSRNLPGVKTLLVHYLNVIDLLKYDNIVILWPAVEVAESFLGNGQPSSPAADDKDQPTAPAQSDSDAEPANTDGTERQETES
jgi:large subunit ribosomal protein L4